MALISGVQVNDNTYGLRAEAIPIGSITSDTNGILTATVPKITQLTPGIICIINNSLNLSSNIISLNVNSFGAKPIYDSMTNSTIRNFILKSNETFLFSYNETLLSTGCWLVHNGPSHCADLVDYSPYNPGEDSALIFTLELNGTSVSLNRNFLTVQEAFYSNLKTFFVLFPTQYTGIIFEVSYVDVANQIIHLSSQQQNNRYYIILTPVTSATMGGTLYTINIPSSNPEIGNGYTTCDTAKTTLTKTAALTNYVLDKGYVSVKFTYDVLANSTLNINSTGVKSIYYRGSAITDGIICANDIALFCYDGTNYNLISIDKSCEGAIATTNVFKITITYDNSTFTSDKTFSEIAAAYALGQPIEVLCDYMMGWVGKVGVSSATIYTIDKNANGATLYAFEITSSSGYDVTIASRNLGNADKPTVTTLTGTTQRFVAADNHIYKCGELTSLTITGAPNTGEFMVIFTSGSTATTLTMPQSVTMPDSFTVETNTRYEINVMDGYAVAQGWAVSASV